MSGSISLFSFHSWSHITFCNVVFLFYYFFLQLMTWLPMSLIVLDFCSTLELLISLRSNFSAFISQYFFQRRFLTFSFIYHRMKSPWISVPFDFYQTELFITFGSIFQCFHFNLAAAVLLFFFIYVAFLTLSSMHNTSFIIFVF